MIRIVLLMRLHLRPFFVRDHWTSLTFFFARAKLLCHCVVVVSLNLILLSRMLWMFYFDYYVQFLDFRSHDSLCWCHFWCTFWEVSGFFNSFIIMTNLFNNYYYWLLYLTNNWLFMFFLNLWDAKLHNEIIWMTYSLNANICILANYSMYSLAS